MPDSIEAVKVLNNAGEDQFKTRWGSSVYDYNLNGYRTDFQDLLVAISEHRANAVEGQVTPMSTRMRQRNAKLELYGTVLAELTKLQSNFKSDDKGNIDMSGWFTSQTADVLKQFCPDIGVNPNNSYETDDDLPDNDERYDFYYIRSGTSAGKCSANKKTIDGLVEKTKKVIDSLNNAAQMDMNRLQTLMDRRDESYSTATTIMTHVSDTRANLIRNL